MPMPATRTSCSRRRSRAPSSASMRSGRRGRRHCFSFAVLQSELEVTPGVTRTFPVALKVPRYARGDSRSLTALGSCQQHTSWEDVPMRIKRRTFNSLAVAGAASGFAGSGHAQAKPITIGFGMALTGGLAPVGKRALLGMQLAEEDINGRGGILGRPVKLIYYDDQSSPSAVPALYTKLIDVDKVDIVTSGYATNMIAPAMPIVMQKDRTFF